MCGIVGFTAKHLDTPAEVVDRALASIAHRGPDQHGSFLSDCIRMGAVRLKILDLEGGDQPIRSDDGQSVICYNGEVYNFAEIRAELESLGHRFHSHSDTEVILKAWLQWDNDCFRRFRGMFAIALWNEPARRLVLARDRLGIKPLYLRHHGEDLFFASELKALFAHPAVPRLLDWQGVNDFLSLNYIPNPLTAIAGIEKLAAGSWLEWQNGRIRGDSFWQLQFQPASRITEEEAAAELDTLLASAVREHLLSDVPVGLWLSGGLDSSTVLHYAAQASSRPIQTFSVSFPGRTFDESSRFRVVARHYGAEHHELPVDESMDLAHTVEQLVHFSDEPSADAGAVPIFHLSRLCRRNITVALSGEGADELFGGYVTYLADRYHRWAQPLPQTLKGLGLRIARTLLPVSDEKIGLDYKAARFLEGCRLPADEAHFYWNGTSSRDLRAALLRRSPVPAGPGRLGANLPAPGQCGGWLNRYLLLDQRYYLPDDILNKCDRMSMAHSLEVRPALLDHRIVEFAAGLPESFKIRGSTLKWILRRAMRGKLPQVVLDGPKQGLDIPAHQWFRGPLRPLFEDVVTEKRIRETGLFSWPQVETLKNIHFRRKANVGYHLWGILFLTLWMSHWKIEPPSDSAGP